MNELAVIEVIGMIVVPTIGFAIGWIRQAFNGRLTELVEEVKELEAKIEAHKSEAQSWQLGATDRFARRDETREEFNQVQETLRRMDSKLDTMISRLIPSH